MAINALINTWTVYNDMTGKLNWYTGTLLMPEKNEFETTERHEEKK